MISQPERELWGAVVIRALDDLAETGKEAPRLRQAARAWLMSDKTRVGSFIWICESVGLDAAAVRRALSIWRADRAA